MSADFHPWRRRVKPIQPLIESLEFIRNKKSWGFVFRRGLFEIPQSNFAKIAAAMKRS